MGVVRFDRIARECRETHKGGFEGIPIVGLEHIEPYEMRLKNYDINVETTFTKRFHEGQILFGRRRAYQHKACVATCDGICSGDITVIEPIEGQVYPGLLPFIIQNDDFFEHAIKGSNGALSPRVKWKHMANYEVNLPPLAEQKLRAEKLWAAYEVKQSYLKMIKATQEMVQSQFIEMFGTIESNFYNFPICSIGETCEVLNGYAFQSNKYVNEGIRVIRIANVQKGFIEDSDPQFYPIELASEFEKYTLHEGDLLLSLTGNVGRVGLLPKELLPAALNQRVACIRPKESINKVFLFRMMNLDLFEKACIDNASGSAQKNMSTEWLKEYKFLLPSMDEQNKFVSIAHQADKSEFELRKSIDAIDAVIKSLINS